MRILHAITFLTGGAGRVLHDLAFAQRADGHEVRILANATEYPGYTHYPEYLDAFAKKEIPVLLVDSVFKRESAMNQGAVAAVQEHFRGVLPDVVHAHASIPADVAHSAFAMEAKAPPVVQTMQGWGLNKTSAMEAQDVTIMNKLAGVAALNQSGRRLLEAKGVLPAKIEVVPNGIVAEAPTAIDEDATLLSTLSANEGKPSFLCVGDIGHRKNQALLMEALGILGDRGIHAKGTFVGREEDTGFFERTAARFKVEQAVHWLGYRQDAPALIPKFDAVVLPSRSEGLPLALLEAFRASVPFLGADIPEIAEIIRHGENGFLFPLDDASALADLLDDFSKGSLPMTGPNGKKDFHASFTLEHMALSYQRLYESVCR